MSVRNVSTRVVEQPSGGWLVYECRTLDFHAMQIPDPSVETLIGQIYQWSADNFQVCRAERRSCRDPFVFKECDHTFLRTLPAAIRWAIINLPRS